MKKILKYCFNTSVWSPNKQEWLTFISALPKEERDRVSSFAFKRDSKQTLIGQILIRFCLKNLLNIDWDSIALGRNIKNRPYLKTKETLCLAKLNSFDNYVDFNVSHSGDYTIIVAGIFSINSKKKSEEFDDGPKIGTDVMKIDIDRSKLKYPNETDEVLFRNELELHERVINSKFTNNEKNYIYNRPNPVEKLTAFYRLWCLKESYVKAIGDGIGFDIKRIECLVNSELLIDLNSKKYLVVNDSQLFVDSKLVKNCKFYEQYFMDSLNTNKPDQKPQLHIMTHCIIENEKSANQNTQDLIKEFQEIYPKDLLNCLISFDTFEENEQKEFEVYWNKFSQKDEKPFNI